MTSLRTLWNPVGTAFPLAYNCLVRYNPLIHHRRSIRLKGYDYTQPGAYSVTLVTHHREPRFGEINANEIQLSMVGRLVAYQWSLIPSHFPAVTLDEWVIMPNHLHGIIVLEAGGCTGEASAGLPYASLLIQSADASPQLPIGTVAGSLGAILQNFKSVSTRKVNQAHSSPGSHLWQRDYYEHIIRNETEWQRIRSYIRQNPQNWQQDLVNPSLHEAHLS